MTGNSEPMIAGLLLAAGGSSRLGRPKQLVEFEGKTLIRRAAEALIGAGCSPVYVVLGAEVERPHQELYGLGVHFVINDSWQVGMGSSIARGMGVIISTKPSPDAVLISLCDHPFVTAESLRPFLTAFRQSRTDLVAASYNDNIGVPALFSARFFGALSALDGKIGAQELIRNSSHALTIPLPEAAIDIDVPEDLLRILSFES
ncbi:MAG: nucleotidyltransferase family protein [bacterium]|nr:nucleotidyltransferase family protein [bacterium]